MGGHARHRDARRAVNQGQNREPSTLAAALALPDGTADTAFPYRDLIILCAFCVVLTTLVLQGLTLRPLLAMLGLKDDGSVSREVRLARIETARAALQVLADEKDGHPSIDVLRSEYEARIRSGERPAAAETDETRMTELQRRAVRAQRQVLMSLRARKVIGDDAFHAAAIDKRALDPARPASGRGRTARPCLRSSGKL